MCLHFFNSAVIAIELETGLQENRGKSPSLSILFFVSYSQKPREAYNSVNSNHEAFVGRLSFCFGKAANFSTVGLKNRVQMPHPKTTLKLRFPVNKLQIPNLWVIPNNLIKTLEAPYANRT